MSSARLTVVGVVVLIGLAVAPVAGQSQGSSDGAKDLLKGLGIGSSSSSIGNLTTAEISRGLREALRVGSERVVSTLGRADGFNNAPDVHIPLPGSLKNAQKMLAKVGKSKLADDLELRLNRAAEAAVPKAKTLFVAAISEMTIDDAKGILSGPKDSATQYFRDKMSTKLAGEMTPIVDEQLTQVGAIASYDKMMKKYKSMPFVPDVKADLSDYVVAKAVDGVFLYLGREETAIRENPAKRSTELLQKVFGQAAQR
jgi:Protein of unknown function (DUF4197)